MGRKDKKRRSIALMMAALAILSLSLANAQTAVIEGTDADDELIGTLGDDIINGRHGGDMMMGLAGNDTYIVNDLADQVVEQADEGTDTVRVYANDYTLPANVENLIMLWGGYGFGNDLANRMVGAGSGHSILDGGLGDDVLISRVSTYWLLGGDGNDILRGGTAPDVLVGGPGNDILTGGGGGDQFLFPEYGGKNADRITDFDLGDDFISLAFWHPWSPFGIYSGIEVLKRYQFIVGPSATTPEQRIVYNPENGWLYFDRDGSGPVPGARFARLSPHLALTYQHFRSFIHAVPYHRP